MMFKTRNFTLQLTLSEHRDQYAMISIAARSCSDNYCHLLLAVCQQLFNLV